jgi:hypothetical protein
MWGLGGCDDQSSYSSWPKYTERGAARLSIVLDLTEGIASQRKNDVFSRSPLLCGADELASAYRVDAQGIAFGARIAPRPRGIDFNPLIFSESLVGLQKPIRDRE